MKKIILPVVLITFFFLIFAPGFFVKAKIGCRSQYGECPPQVTESFEGLNGKRIYTAKRQLKKNLESNFLVSAFTIQFKLPNILRVDLVVKKPIFALKDRGSGDIALVDMEGTVLAHSTSTNLPLVNVDEALPPVGGSVSSKNLVALKLIQGMFEMYQTTTGSIEGDTLLVDLPGAIRVIFPLAGFDIDKLLGSVRLIYTNIQDKQSQGLYSQIDLRYINPVLR